MTSLEVLRQRRELVVLSASLQRATIVRRLQYIESNPARVALGFAAKAVSHPPLWRLGKAAVAFAVRAYRRRSAHRGANQQTSSH
ncbi:MAG TPA: hypothetical protein VN878_08170 [Usitatibacter sp.]|nr:hypothetical protein [Usitatibacter sp.]